MARRIFHGPAPARQLKYFPPPAKKSAGMSAQGDDWHPFPVPIAGGPIKVMLQKTCFRDPPKSG